MIKEYKNQLTALVIVAVLVIVYFAVQNNRIVAEKKLADDKASAERVANVLYNMCVNEAEDAYWSYMELNGTGKRDGIKGVSAPQRFWDNAETNKQHAITNCFNQYKK